MKRCLYNFSFLTLLLLCCSQLAWAQQTITGKVVDNTQQALPGVNVIIKGGLKGTATGANGEYSISANSGDVLVFSYLGFANQEITVGNQSTINVTLQAEDRQLTEVVVTALGVEREKKALGYTVAEVAGANLTQARENNLANALAGRVAGVNVSSVASGPAGSSRVVIRGNKSLQGNNQPLYVIDGIPMDNSNFGQAGVWGGADRGDGMASINPDDIESITVLKGASAAALYGARAANGVINITTKKGSARKGIGVEFNSNYVFERINDQTDLQKEFGSGNYQRSNPNDPTSPFTAVRPTTIQQAYDWGGDSWGPRYDGAPVMHFDGVSRPYSHTGDNWDRFYETGSTWTNTLALTGGGENQTFRFAVSDLRSKAVVPNSGFDRFNVSLATNGKFGNRVLFNAKVLYSHEKADNRPSLSDSPNNAFQSIYRMPGNHNVLDYKGDPNKLGGIPAGTDPNLLRIWGKSVGEEFQQANNNWLQNPYWAAYQYSVDDERDRVIPSAQLRYNVTDFLYVSARAGMDWFTRRDQTITPQGTGHTRGGSMNEGEDRVREINLEATAGFDKTFGKFGVNAFIGANRMRRKSERLNLNGNAFNVPFEQFINNTVTRTWDFGTNQSGINSLFGSAEVSYGGFIYLTATARKDWFSVLNPDINDITYPSIGGSFVFTEAFNALPTWLSFGKIRASWAQVGSVSVQPYQTVNTYSLLGATHLGVPMGSFSTATGNGGTIPNRNLLPYTSTEFEIGTDLRFLEDRLGVEFTYYSQKTTDDILNATISRASGFGSTLVNVGELTNKGVEVLLSATPLRGALTWDVSLNLARNRNKVIQLIEGNDELIVEEPRTRTVFVKHIVGQPFGVLTGFVQKTSPDGQPVFEANGAPVQAEKMQVIGNGLPDWTGGINNSFNYKNFHFDFLIDFKLGGDIYSGTNVRLTQWGLHKQTLQGREGYDAITVNGVIQNGTDGSGNPVYEPFTKTLTPQEARNYWNQTGERRQDMFVYDASFLKLRQLTFGYTFPNTMLNKTPFSNLRLSFVGRNLSILWKNTDNIDPESSYSSGNGQGLDYFAMPRTRSYGFNLSVGF
ncbi:SusC/RagA family TonB-linked outer membrane protein [Rhodocytophaga aerolata]|uniref:SusC/RagA family TonB-linked outer membrane protein n=1 Tax=Rhodocytophaga aerolata TaxID=455078 RepID=A0ABT8R351_9BACT|nr:SusC/RagA family TonB-linked outer membrane protein [Rhodocytophaga aerolata]MDO1445075.1 SusC/RagA family TonB-linked outer membrane protein [Rhodocytophaga aerolata]